MKEHAVFFNSKGIAVGSALNNEEWLPFGSFAYEFRFNFIPENVKGLTIEQVELHNTTYRIRSFNTQVNSTEQVLSSEIL